MLTIQSFAISFTHGSQRFIHMNSRVYEQDARLYVALGVWHKFESRMPDHSPYIQLITAARGSQYDAMKTIICGLLPDPGWWAEYSKVCLTLLTATWTGMTEPLNDSPQRSPASYWHWKVSCALQSPRIYVVYSVLMPL